MTTKIPNSEKILIVLKHYDSSITSSDLAEYCHINNKNIGRYLDKLAEKKLISRKTIQEGKKRYIENKILQRGKNKKVNFTYDEVMKEIETTDMKEAVEINQKNDNISEITENDVIIKTVLNPKEYDEYYIAKQTNKTTLLRYIKTIAIRDLDGKRLGFKDKSELIEEIIDIILKL